MRITARSEQCCNRPTNRCTDRAASAAVARTQTILARAAARYAVLLAPFRAGTAHVMPFRPVGPEQVLHEAAPPAARGPPRRQCGRKRRGVGVLDEIELLRIVHARLPPYCGSYS